MIPIKADEFERPKFGMAARGGIRRCGMEDKALRKLVQDELDWQPSIDAANIGVAVDNGIVHLTGHVTSYAQRWAAENAVKKIRGVRGYVEDLEIRPSARADTDDAIAERAATLLDWDVAIPKDVVKVKVDNGHVTLTGEVDWAFQRKSAEAAVRHLSGMRGLNNLITVKPQAQASDVKRCIEDALERQAEIDAKRISITVNGDRVSLNGKVRGWYERALIEDAAWAAPGVQWIDDHMTVGG